MKGEFKGFHIYIHLFNKYYQTTSYMWKEPHPSNLCPSIFSDNTSSGTQHDHTCADTGEYFLDKCPNNTAARNYTLLKNTQSWSITPKQNKSNAIFAICFRNKQTLCSLVMNAYCLKNVFTLKNTQSKNTSALTKVTHYISNPSKNVTSTLKLQQVYRQVDIRFDTNTDTVTETNFNSAYWHWHRRW